MKKSMYERVPQHDRRIRRGDDFAGDAYYDRKGKRLMWVVVGHNPNECPDCEKYGQRDKNGRFK